MVSVGDIHGNHSQDFRRVNDVLLEEHRGNQLKSKLVCVVWRDRREVRAGDASTSAFWRRTYLR